MESEDYERQFETIIIPPVHVTLHCDNRLPIWEQQGYARASNLVKQERV
jgi:hypothetical protein